MERGHARHIRSERLIAVGRLVLAASSLLAIWLDPFEPARYVAASYTLLAAYLVYALLLIGWAAAAELSDPRLGHITHVIDLTIVSVLLYLTEGSTSPLFAYFLFALLAAALRWRWRGVLWTALATLAIYIGLSLYAERVLHDAAFELNRFIIRSVYLAVAALLLGYLSSSCALNCSSSRPAPRHVAPEAQVPGPRGGGAPPAALASPLGELARRAERQ